LLPGWSGRDFYSFAYLPETYKTLRKREKYPDYPRIQVERALRRAFIERAQERPLHLATLTQFRNSGLWLCIRKMKSPSPQRVERVVRQDRVRGTSTLRTVVCLSALSQRSPRQLSWLSDFYINKTTGKDACCYFIGIMSGVRAEYTVQRPLLTELIEIEGHTVL